MIRVYTCVFIRYDMMRVYACVRYDKIDKIRYGTCVFIMCVQKNPNWGQPRIIFCQQNGTPRKVQTRRHHTWEQCFGPLPGAKKTFLWQCAIPKVMESFGFLWKMWPPVSRRPSRPRTEHCYLWVFCIAQDNKDMRKSWNYCFLSAKWDP